MVLMITTITKRGRMDYNKIFLTCLIFLFNNILIWYQLNSQLVWQWAKGNTAILLSCLMGVPISYLFIVGTKYGYAGFNNVLWGQRLMGFGLGIVVFALCTWFFLNEGITTKTIVSLSLAFTLVLIQIFW